VKPRLALLLPLLVAPPALAQTRPVQTEEATTASAGTMVMEAGGDWIHAEPNYLTGRVRDRYDAPVLRFVASPSDNVELDVEWVGRVGVQRDPDFGSVSDWGDVSLRAKVRFGRERAGRPSVAARFGVTLPETSFGDGLGPNTMRMLAQLLMTAPLGNARLHLNAGLALQDEVLRPHEQRDFIAFGAALEAPLAKRVTGLAEIAGRAGNGRPGADQRIEARGGVRVAVGRVRWDAAIRRGLSDAVGKWGFTAGLAWRLR
jgi:hypothetical protein